MYENICINGSRSFVNQDYLDRQLTRLIKNPRKVIFRNGKAIGADTLALNWIKNNNVPEEQVILHLPIWNIKDPDTGNIIYDKSAGFKRDYEMISSCNRLISFWDGQSKGTLATLKLAKEQNKSINLFRVDRVVFVFGSNLGGRHDKGAAKFAAAHYGASRDIPKGISGMSYAIPTKDKDLNVLSLNQIEKYIEEFKDYARDNEKLTFHITRVGCGLAGYSDSEIAPLFQDSPSNCDLPLEWC